MIERIGNDFRLAYLIGDRSLYQKMVRIAVPISLQMLITVGINLMDTIMLSSMGDAQLSASTLAGQFINMFQICCMGISMGASVLTSRFWGMKDLSSLRQAVAIMLRITLLFVSAFTLVTAFSPGLIMRMYTGEKEIIDFGIIYLRWMIPTYFCMGISVTCTVILRTTNQVRLPLWSSIVAFFVNVFCNWVFIFGHMGAPRMEIAGAALGTLIARIGESLFIGGYFFLLDKRIGFRVAHLFSNCRGLLKEYIRISIPVLVSDILLGLGLNMLSVVMGHISSAFVAANSIVNVAQQLSSTLYQGVSNVSAIITGHTMGEGHYEKARRDGFAFLMMGLVLGLLGCGLILLVKNSLINYYDVSAEAKEIAGYLLDAMSIIIIFLSAGHILTKGVLRAGGDTVFLMMGDILFLWIASIPLGYLSGLVWNWPPFWVYFCLRIDQVIKCVWCTWKLFSGRWLKAIEGTNIST